MPLRRLKPYTAVILGALVLIAALAAYYVVGLYWTKLVLDIMLFGLAAVICLTWWPAAMSAFTGGARIAADKVILTVWLTWTAIFIQRSFVLISTYMERPTWLTESPFPVMIVSVGVIAGAYAAYATVSETEVPIQERRQVLIATFVGGILTGIILTLAIFGFHF